jgi:CDP-diacylglycerol--glycerol-3-phosphate 3-phosphatidyltransferase
VALVVAGNVALFKWLLIASFLTDALDGFLARRLGASTKLGAKLDSAGDMLTYAAAVVGLIITRPEFFRGELFVISIVLGLNLLQIFFAFGRFGRMSSFHTYLAKVAAILLSAFLISSFFTEDILYPLFYVASAVTILDLIEEIILILIIPRWQTDVKGLYWVLRNKNFRRV